MKILNFIDLEGTVIDSWNEPRVINHYLRDELEGKELIVFSFALLNQEDRIHFFQTMRDEIEIAFNCKIVQPVIIDDATKEIAKEKFMVLKDQMDEIHFRNLLGKETFFLEFCKRFVDTTITLWDDVIEDKKIHDLKRNNFIELKRV